MSDHLPFAGTVQLSDKKDGADGELNIDEIKASAGGIGEHCNWPANMLVCVRILLRVSCCT